MQTSKRHTGSLIVKGNLRPRVDDADWIDADPGEEHYTANKMRGVLRAGVEPAPQSQQEWTQGRRTENAVKAASHTRKIVEWLCKKGIHPVAALLNERRYDAPEVLILVPTDEYCALPEGLYSYIGKKEQEWSNSDYSIRFSFTYDGPRLNRKLLRSDGFRSYYTSLQER